jgi:hypothetical protein
MGIISKSPTVSNTGPRAGKPDGTAGNRTRTIGSRPVRGDTKTPSSESKDTSGHLGRKPGRTRGDDPS